MHPTSVKQYFTHFITDYRRLLVWTILAAGIFLRLMVWWQQRPIVLDEANLIRNYVERTYGGLFQNLDYEQYAPPLFSMCVKATISLFGINELSVRLFPLLCSIGTLLLFGRLVFRFLKFAAAVAALAFVAFGKVFTDYATECKQYATDGLITMLLLELFFRLNPPHGFNRNTFLWALTGAVAVWFSMPAVFVLAGIGLYWLWQSWQQKNTKAFTGNLLAISCWLLSFGFYFWLLLLHNAKSDYLQNYHQEYFLTFPPLNATELDQMFTQLGRFVSKAIGKTALAKILTGAGLIAVILHMILRRRENKYQLLFWLILLPILFCLAASALRYYSLLTRLTLFFLPLLILLVFAGLESIARHRIVTGVIPLLVLIVLGNQQYLTEVNKPFHGDFAEVREALKFVASEQQPGEVILASDDVLPVMRHYTLYNQPALPLKHTDLKKLGYGKNVSMKIDSLRNLGHRKVWLVASIFDSSFAEMAARPDRILKRKDDFSGYALLYRID